MGERVTATVGLYARGGSSVFQLLPGHRSGCSLDKWECGDSGWLIDHEFASLGPAERRKRACGLRGTVAKLSGVLPSMCKFRTMFRAVMR